MDGLLNGIADEAASTVDAEMNDSPYMAEMNAVNARERALLVVKAKIMMRVYGLSFKAAVKLLKHRAKVLERAVQSED